jgi:hypothetical protein
LEAEYFWIQHLFEYTTHHRKIPNSVPALHCLYAYIATACGGFVRMQMVLIIEAQADFL